MKPASEHDEQVAFCQYLDFVHVDVEGYANLYKVTSCGKIWSCITNRWLKYSKKRNGYLSVTLVKNGIKSYFLVHRLVAIAFIGLNVDKKYINHKNGVKHDNRVENIEWVTPSENNTHALKNKLSRPPRGVKRKDNTSGFVGVVKNNKNWQAQILVDGKHKYLGTFKTKVEAAKAYDIASVKYHGDSGKRNFNEVS